MRITLPQKIRGNDFLPFLAELDKPLAAQEPVMLDVSALRRVTPTGLVALVATVRRWQQANHPVTFEGLQACPITGYLQRMDLFQASGLALPETFQRHAAQGRFVPVRLIDHRIDEMGNDLAACLAPGGEDLDHPLSNLYSLAWYVLTETGNNVQQHSRGRGYVAAQVNRTEGLVRLAIADNGRGILRSFQDAGLPWSVGMDDPTAIRKALDPQVSSRGRPSNEGVGLTLVAGLVSAIGGWMLIVSGTGVLSINRGSTPVVTNLPGQARYQGTLLGLTFRQTDVSDYASLLERIKVTSGLLQPATRKIKFTP